LTDSSIRACLDYGERTSKRNAAGRATAPLFSRAMSNATISFQPPKTLGRRGGRTGCLFSFFFSFRVADGISVWRMSRVARSHSSTEVVQPVRIAHEGAGKPARPISQTFPWKHGCLWYRTYADGLGCLTSRRCPRPEGGLPF